MADNKENHSPSEGKDVKPTDKSDDNKKWDTVPRSRLNEEIAEKKRLAKLAEDNAAKLREYEKKEQEATEKKMEEEWKWKEINETLKTENETLKTQMEALTKDNETMSGIFDGIVSEKVESLTSGLDEEKKATFLDLLWDGSSAEKLSKLPKMEKLLWTMTTKKKSADPSGKMWGDEKTDFSTMTREERVKYRMENR